MFVDFWVLGIDILCVDVGKFIKVLREKNICLEYIIIIVIEGIVVFLNLSVVI